jgi:hypothetical protein
VKTKRFQNGAPPGDHVMALGQSALQARHVISEA